jgi:MraZ protein
MGALFLSTYNNKIDAKGRVSMPANFRDIITKDNETNVIIYKSLSSLKPCLEGCTNGHIEKLQDAIGKFDPFSEEKDAFETAIFSDSVSLDIDKDGRINIPKQYIQYAKINKVALFVGKGKTFEIWNPEIYAEYSQKCRSFAVKNATLIKW